MKPCSVTRKVYKKILIEVVVPSITAKWPDRTPRKLRMQHDNAPAHVASDDKEVIEAGIKGRSTILLDPQPPNSPDFNILDIEMFAGIQPIQYEAAPRNVQVFVSAVRNVYTDYDPMSIEDKFITLQKVMESSMRVRGERLQNSSLEKERSTKYEESVI